VTLASEPCIEEKGRRSTDKDYAGKYFLASENWVMERVQEAVSQLSISGQPHTIKAICEETGISKIGLYRYDRVKTFLGGVNALIEQRKSPPHSGGGQARRMKKSSLLPFPPDFFYDYNGK
jgi:hypothetical protein